MKRVLLLLAVFIILSGVSAVQAETKIGVAPGLIAFSVDDPDGDTESANAAAPLALAVVYDLNNRSRIFSTFTYLSFDLDAGTNRIGQEVTGYQLNVAYQHIIKFSYEFQFYLGAGLTYMSADFKNRYTVDADGYLASRYSDRQENIFGAALCLSKEWEIHPKVDLGFDVSYQHALQSGGVSGFKGAVTCFYKF